MDTEVKRNSTITVFWDRRVIEDFEAGRRPDIPFLSVGERTSWVSRLRAGTAVPVSAQADVNYLIRILEDFEGTPFFWRSDFERLIHGD